MDEFQKKDPKNEIDLTEFDLTDFKEYFDEEDAQREAEAIEVAEREAAEEAARLAEEERIRLEEQRKKEEEERKAAEELAARKKAEFEAREKEEARRAAEKAAAAALAAKKAEEAKLQEQKEISARLFEQADVNNEMIPDQPKVETVADEASKIEFAAFSSILDIENNTVNEQQQQPTFDDETPSGFLADKSKKKSTLAVVICVILCIATIICSTLAVLNFKDRSSADENSNEQNVTAQNNRAESFKPFDNLTISYNNVAYPDSINEKLKAMYSENSDLAGWLTIENSAIDYPIMQDSENKYYLYNHNSFDESARYGTPFVDFRCSKNGLSKNTIIYGHRMNNDTHFGSLDNYADVKYYKSHPIIKYDTLTGSYTFKIYAAFYATTQSSSDGGYVFDYYNPYMSDNNFEGYINMLNQYALYTTDAGLEKTDKIITLSTCSHFYDNLKSGGVDARFVVVGRLLRNGESETVDTSKVTQNSDYRRPQLWYDKNGQSNPYAAYRSWRPSM
ncbi:MAG: class B sortase [Clostridia bacterium]|nr:class B sortase [Clostridia bacterium]